MMAYRFFSIFAFLLSGLLNSAAASDCPTITLDEGNGTAAGIPVWNQKNRPACYSYTASLLATVWVREEWSKAQPDLQSFIDDPLQSFRNIRRSNQYSQILDADTGRTCQALDFILDQVRSRTQNPKHPQFSTPRCVMWGFVQESATSPNQLRTASEFSERMHSLLEDQPRPLPFAIEYCSRTFNLPNQPLITNRTFRSNLNYLNDDKASTENLSKRCGFHAAVVTGQAMRDGVCSFRVRNSGGPINTPFIDHGYFWIPARDLARNTLRVITLQHE